MRRTTYDNQSIETLNTKHYDLVQFKKDGMFVSVDIDGYYCEIRCRSGAVKKEIRLEQRHQRSVFVGEWMKGTERSKDSDVKLWLFDCAVSNDWNVESLHYLHRMVEARRVEMPKEVVQEIGKVQVIDTYGIDTARRLWSDVESGKEEGLIVRRNAMPIRATVGRVKPIVEKDFYVVGLYYDSQDQVIAVGGATTPGGEQVIKARVSPYANHDGFRMGRCFVVEGQEITGRGSVRFGYFKRWHNEK